MIWGSLRSLVREIQSLTVQFTSDSYCPVRAFTVQQKNLVLLCGYYSLDTDKWAIL